MQKFEYVGCFFDYEELKGMTASVRKFPLEVEKTTPHITFEFGPETVDESLFGTEITVTVIGYGNNGENEGLKVTLTSDNDIINEMIKKIPVPHITLSVSENGKAVNTRYLDFTSIHPFTIKGYYGGFELK